MTEYELKSKEIEKEFLAEFKALLLKYDATISADDHWNGYAECGRDIRIEIDIDSKYDAEGNMLRPYVSIDLGSRYYAK